MQNPIENGDRVAIHERLASLETQIETILTNHLPHIQKELERLNRVISWGVVLFITNLVALLYAVVENAVLHK